MAADALLSGTIPSSDLSGGCTRVLGKRAIRDVAPYCLLPGLVASCDLSTPAESVCNEWLRERDVSHEQMPDGRLPTNFDSSRIAEFFDYEEFGESQNEAYQNSTIVWFSVADGTSMGCIVFEGSDQPNAFVRLSADQSEVEPIDFRIIGPS